ncbi:putative RING-H2 finger protein ATL53 [Alnus glutinosa]|uniref:putative RING-H2 finger protein ATL53 n=1 Tax=Alnus glutinosa TaxID=3517 RepID=UPI002D774D61|nr:putative RING-H2 finger protein ATL53 [Alnus glutinosa]
MASNDVTTPVESFEIGPNDGSPLSEGELWVKFLAVKLEHPEEEEILRVRVQRSLLSCEQSAKSIIPLLLSCTNLPEQFHRCPEFIRTVSEYVCNSLPNETHQMYVYGHVVGDAIDPSKCAWSYCLSPEKFSCTDELFVLSRRWSEMQALEEVKLEEASECAICLQDLLVGVEASKLPCSHVYHVDCIVEWFDRSNQCPLCRSQVF